MNYGLKKFPTTLTPGQPSAEDLHIINDRHALRPLTADDVAVYRLRVCSDQIDRDGERFTRNALEDFAETLPGKGLLEGHEWGPVGIGMMYDAHLHQEGAVLWLMGKCYLPRAAKASAEMITKIDTGIAKWVSIGFFAPARYEVTPAGPGATFVELDRLDGQRCEALECSLVFLGAQYDAAITKSAGQKTLQRLEALHRDGQGRKYGDMSFILPRELR